MPRKSKSDTVTLYGHAFEKPRIVQGIIIYAQVLIIITAGYLTKEYWITTMFAAAILIIHIIAFGFYLQKTRSIIKAAAISAMKMLTWPTSMVG